MKTSMAALTLSLFCLSVAEVQQLDHRAGEGNSTKSDNIESASVRAGDITGSQENYGQLVVILRELEAKLRNTEKQLQDLRGGVQGNRVAFGASIGNVGNIGPFNTEITLTYKNVYSNTGAYNPATGVQVIRDPGALNRKSFWSAMLKTVPKLLFLLRRARKDL